MPQPTPTYSQKPGMFSCPVEKSGEGMDTPIVLFTIQTGFKMLQDLPNKWMQSFYEGDVEQVNWTCE